MAANPKISDVVIVGGGFAGLTLALALAGPKAKTQMDVTILDIKPLNTLAASIDDGRASSLVPSSQAMLHALDVWAEIEQHVQPVHSIRVTDSRLDAASRPQFLHFGEERRRDDGPLSYMIENRFLNAALAAQVKASSRIKVLAPAHFTSYEALAGHVVVTLKDGTQLKTSLLVGSDGRNSVVRDATGLKTIGWSYDQCGIVTNVAHEKPHNGVAEEHFLPSGPFAILPLTGNRSSLVWTEEEGLARHLMSLGDEEFLVELRRRFKDHLGEVTLAGPRWSYPLVMHLARDYVVERVALIGDAAHGIHPIAGLGLNLGLRDVAALAEAIVDAAHLGLDIGGAQVLEKYQVWRRFDNVSTVAMCDGLNRMFSNDNAGLRALRDAGLQMVDGLAPVKRFFSGEASGTSGDTPKLLRGELI